MSTTQTAAGRIKRSAPRWSNLSDDIIGVVRSRIAASPRDLVRFAAVCKPWRAAASRQPALHLAPLLLLSSLGRNNKNKTHHLCGLGLHDCWVFRAPSKTANNMRFIGSHDGGWVALWDKESYTLAIMNLFSGAEMPLSQKQRENLTPMAFLTPPSVLKIIFSGDPAACSNGCILAAVVDGSLLVTLCKAGSHHDDGRWITCPVDKVVDTAFCDGDLYALASPMQGGSLIIKLAIFGTDGDCMLGVTAMRYLHIRWPTFYDNTNVAADIRYIFELHGKPAMALRSRWLPDLDPFFKIFEIVDLAAPDVYEHTWAEVTSFGDYALFIGPTRSRAVHVPMSAEHGGLKRNQIYYTKYTHSFLSKSQDDAVNLVKSDDGDEIKMYCKKDQSFEDGIERIGYYVTCLNYAMWVHPPEL